MVICYHAATVRASGVQANSPIAREHRNLIKTLRHRNPIAVKGQAYLSFVTTWMTDRLKERAQIQKQSRLYPEDVGRRGAEKLDGGEEGQDGDGKSERKKK